MPSTRIKLFRGCAKFVNQGGCFITDMDAYDEFSSIRNSKKVMYIHTSRIKRFLRQFFIGSEFVLIMDRKFIDRYAGLMEEKWNQMKLFEKIPIWYDIYFERLVSKIGIFKLLFLLNEHFTN